MTSNGISKLFYHMQGFYPQAYPQNMSAEKKGAIIEGFAISFKGIDDEAVFEAMNRILRESDKTPSIATILSHVRGRRDETMGSATGWDLDNEGKAIPRISGSDISPSPKCPNPNSRALRAMLRARPNANAANKDPHDWAWYKSHYPERPEDAPMDIDEIIASF